MTLAIVVNIKSLFSILFIQKFSLIYNIREISLIGGNGWYRMCKARSVKS